MLANQILFMAGAAFVHVSSSPAPQILDFCPEVDCPSPPRPDNTIGYTCNPPIVDASNVPLPYTFKNPTADQKAVNRRIEKAMGRGECSYTDSQLKEIFDIFGSDLASVYPPTDYTDDEKKELAAQPACLVGCVDPKNDQALINWCHTNNCPTPGIDTGRVYLSPDGIVRYKQGDLIYNTYPCTNPYLTLIAADLCPVLEAQDLGSTRNCVETCFSSLG